MSKHIEYNKNGNPTFAIVGDVLITSSGNDTMQTVVKSDRLERDIEIGGYRVAPWFDPDNNYPNKLAIDYLSKSEALASAIDYKTKICLSQGFYAVDVKSVDTDGNEELVPINDPNVNKFLRSPMIRRFALEAYKSLFSYGMAFPQIVTTKNGEIYSATVFKAKNCRFEKRTEGEFNINNLLLLPNWDAKDDSLLQTVKILNQSSWNSDDAIALAKKMGKFCLPLGLGSATNSYYSEAPWDVARNSGTLDMSLKIAEYLDKMFDNQMSIKYHIKIPYAYWDKKFPKEEYATPELKQKRQQLIESEITKIEESLTKAKSARKALITHFEIGKNGNAEEQWEVEVIDDKFKNDQYLPHSASATAGIFTAMGINPAVKGLAMAAGPYANNQGGSNIREAFLIDVALSWVDRQEVNDLIELMLHLQFPQYINAEVRSRIMVLTTLDTGSQSKMGSI